MSLDQIKVVEMLADRLISIETVVQTQRETLLAALPSAAADPEREAELLKTLDLKIKELENETSRAIRDLYESRKDLQDNVLALFAQERDFFQRTIWMLGSLLIAIVALPALGTLLRSAKVKKENNG
ncbi:MAG: hypothetical protein WBE26_09905 [Phycisphaerae bacterium]